MKKVVAIAAVLVLALTLLTACGPTTIVGKWGGSLLVVSYVLEFKDDGTYTMEMNGLGQNETSRGTYSVDGDKLTMDGETTSYSIQGRTLYITIPTIGELKLTRR